MSHFGHQTRNKFFVLLQPQWQSPPPSLPVMCKRIQDKTKSRTIFFSSYKVTPLPTHTGLTFKVQRPSKWRAVSGQSTKLSLVQILALVVPQQIPTAHLNTFLTNAILNSYIEGRFYFIAEMVVPQVDKIISTGSNVLKCWLWVFRLLPYLSLLQFSGKHSHAIPFV